MKIPLVLLAISLLFVASDASNSISPLLSALGTRNHLLRQAWNSTVKNCPECDMTIPQIIMEWGYPCQSFEVQTEDGFTLTLFRIPFSPVSTNTTNRPPVLLQHGLLDSSAAWVLNLPRESLAYILADAGFDVWLGNSRGTTYSPATSDAQWAFSWDEMAKYDIPAVINFISQNTGHASIGYVGHSQGTTQAFAAFLLNPAIADKVNVFVALAPALYVGHQQSVLLSILAGFDVDKLFQLFGMEQFLGQSWLIKAVSEIFCAPGVLTDALCEDIIFALCGTNTDIEHNLNATRFEVYTTHTPAGTSVQNMAHWAQSVRSGKYRMYDYGFFGNLKHYGRISPPDYDLTKLTKPLTAVFTGGHDALADPVDVQTVLTQVPASTVIYYKEVPEYEHLDFTWGLDCHEKIYPDVVALLKKYSNK